MNIPYIVSAISEIKGITPDEVVEITSNNAKKIYGIGLDDVDRLIEKMRKNNGIFRSFFVCGVKQH